MVAKINLSTCAALLLAFCVSVSAQQNRNPRARGLGDLGNLMGMLGGGGRGNIAERMLEQIPKEKMSPELLAMSEEFRLIRRRLEYLREKMEKAERELFDDKELSTLYAVYMSKLADYNDALRSNSEINDAQTRLQEIVDARVDISRNMQDPAGRREAWQDMREQMEQRQQLSEEINSLVMGDEKVQEAAKAKSNAADAVMQQHRLLIAADKPFQRMQEEERILRDAEAGLLQLMLSAARESGLIQDPQNRQRRDNRRPESDTDQGKAPPLVPVQ